MSAFFTAGQKAQIEALLLAREHALEQEFQQIAEQTGASSESRVAVAAQLLNDDPETAEEHVQDRQVLLERLDLLRHEQVSIGAALIALREGRLGFCRHCGADIPFDRLQAQPTAQRCLACEDKQERLQA